MKKVLLALVLVFCLSGISFSQTKIAYVDTDYILENIPEYKTAQEKLDQLSVQWQKEIEDKLAEIEKLYKDFQSQAFLLPDDMKKKRQDEIMQKEKEVKELQKQRFGKDGDLFKKRQELTKPIQDKVYNAIEQVALEGGFHIILDKSGAVTLLYANNKLDKSDEVLEKLGVNTKNAPKSKTTPKKK